MKKKKIIIIVCVITLFSLIGIGILVYSYGYVTSNIINRDDKGKYYVAENLRIEYSDGTETLESKENGVFIPGATIIKTFTVKNTGNVDVKFDILFTNIINNFNRKNDVVYELYNDETLLSNGIFPDEDVSYMVGDINLDGVVDDYDYGKLNSFINNIGTLSKLEMIAADLNLDKVLDEKDSPELIKEYINSIGLENSENEYITNIGNLKYTDNIETILKDQTLKIDQSITYTLKINYLTSSENQIEDSGKSINAKISFEQSNK